MEMNMLDTRFDDVADLDIEDPDNPFPGLRPFRKTEVDLFFGREAQVGELLSRLGRSRFLALLGPSGSGKSSLVKAGLLPALHSGFVTAAGSNWRIALFRPENDPIGNLARALNTPGVFGLDSDDDFADMQAVILETTLRNRMAGLSDVCKESRMPDHENLLVVIDQFEELFRFKKAQDADALTNDATFFAQLLIQAAEDPETSIYIVLTMRSDFLGDCTQIPGLTEAVNEGMYLIPRLDRAERRLAIEGPVAVCRKTISPLLVTRLLNDVGDNPDRLPIMQHALMRTWDYWEENASPDTLLDIEHYTAIGGMSKALSRHADEAYNELPDARSRDIAEVMFKSLTYKEGDGRGIRQPTTVRAIAAVAEASPEEIIQVAEPFRRPGRSFLMPPYHADKPLTPDSVLDISHESLMRVWERLIEWVDEEANSRMTYLELAQLAADQQAGKKGFLGDPELQLFLNWQTQKKPTRAWALQYDSDPSYARAMLYLEKSADEQAQEIRHKEEKRQRWLRRMKVATGVSVVFVLILFTVLFWGIANNEVAISAQEAAATARQRAAQDSLKAVSALAQAATARQRAAQDSLKAVSALAKAATARQRAAQDSLKAVSALAKAGEARQRAEEDSLRVDTLKTEATEALALAREKSDEAKADSIRAVKAKAREDSLSQLAMARQLALDAPNKDLRLHRLLALHAYLFHTEEGGSEQDPDIYRALLSSIRDTLDRTLPTKHKDQVRALAASPDDASFVSADNAGKLWIWPRNGAKNKPRELKGLKQPIRALAFVSESVLAACTQQGQIFLWNGTATKTRPQPLTRCDDGARCGSPVHRMFSFDNHLFAVSLDGTLQKWTLGKTDLRQVKGDTLLTGSGTPVKDVAFDPGNETMVIGRADGTLDVYTMEGGQPTALGSRKLSEGRIETVAYHPNKLTVGLSDGHILLFEGRDPWTATPKLLGGHSAGVTGLVFHPDGSLLISGSLDQTVRIWNLKEGGNPAVSIPAHAGWIWSVALTHDGSHIISASADQDVRLWPVHTRDLAEQVFEALDGSDITEDEWGEYITSRPGGDSFVYRGTLQAFSTNR